MKRRQVLWTEVAARDLERIAARLHQDAPGRADRVLERVIHRGDSLATMSHRGRCPPELASIADRTWLEVIEPPWRVLYRIVGDSVEIHAVLDGRRDLQDILLERLVEP
jgi:addiction module RelE/StbE family toxin